MHEKSYLNGEQSFQREGREKLHNGLNRMEFKCVFHKTCQDIDKLDGVKSHGRYGKRGPKC